MTTPPTHAPMDREAWKEKMDDLLRSVREVATMESSYHHQPSLSHSRDAEAEAIRSFLDDIMALQAKVDEQAADIFGLSSRVAFLIGDRGLGIKTILTEQEKAKRFYPLRCSNCGWVGPSSDCGSGEPIPEEGDYDDLTCPKCHFMEMNDVEDSLARPPEEILKEESDALNAWIDQMEKENPPPDV